MQLFKTALTFFFLGLVGLGLSLISLSHNTGYVDSSVSKEDREKRSRRAIFWRSWVLRSGIGVAFFLWLAITGLIWH